MEAKGKQPPVVDSVAQSNPGKPIITDWRQSRSLGEIQSFRDIMIDGSIKTAVIRKETTNLLE